MAWSVESRGQSLPKWMLLLSNVNKLFLDRGAAIRTGANHRICFLRLAWIDAYLLRRANVHLGPKASHENLYLSLSLIDWRLSMCALKKQEISESFRFSIKKLWDGSVVVDCRIWRTMGLFPISDGNERCCFLINFIWLLKNTFKTTFAKLLKRRKIHERIFP